MYRRSLSVVSLMQVVDGFFRNAMCTICFLTGLNRIQVLTQQSVSPNHKGGLNPVQVEPRQQLVNGQFKV